MCFTLDTVGYGTIIDSFRCYYSAWGEFKIKAKVLGRILPSFSLLLFAEVNMGSVLFLVDTGDVKKRNEKQNDDAEAVA